jgi:hypothetical protein
MTRDYEKEKLIIFLNKMRLEGIEGASGLVTQRIHTVIINDHYAKTKREIDVSKLSREELIIKYTQIYNEIYAMEIDYIMEKNLMEGPYVTLS